MPKDNADGLEAFEDEDEPLATVPAELKCLRDARCCLILIICPLGDGHVMQACARGGHLVLTCVARCDVAQAMGEEAAQVGHDALGRVGPAANGEATQFREQGGGLRATARGAGAGLVGRHVRDSLDCDFLDCLAWTPCPGQ